MPREYGSESQTLCNTRSDSEVSLTLCNMRPNSRRVAWSELRERVTYVMHHMRPNSEDVSQTCRVVSRTRLTCHKRHTTCVRIQKTCRRHRVHVLPSPHSVQRSSNPAESLPTNLPPFTTGTDATAPGLVDEDEQRPAADRTTNGGLLCRLTVLPSFSRIVMGMTHTARGVVTQE